MLHPCTNATKLSYFGGSRAGFTVFILLLFLFPAGEWQDSPFRTATTTKPSRFESSPPTVSFLVAYMVAYHRKHRYRKFQRTRRAGDRTEEAAAGLAGM